MQRSTALGTLSTLGAPALGVFRGRTAVAEGVSRRHITALRHSGAIDRVLPDTYRLTAVAPSNEQRLRAALLWAGPEAVVAGRSAGEFDRLEGVRTPKPEIVVPCRVRAESPDVTVHHSDDRDALMARNLRGMPTTGVEATMVALAHVLTNEALEIACEDARRRRLTSIAALRAYLDRFATNGRRGVTALNQLLRELDPVHPSRSTLEVKARRLLVAGGMAGFEREFPLEWNGRVHRFDFAWPSERVILETNGRRHLGQGRREPVVLRRGGACDAQVIRPPLHARASISSTVCSGVRPVESSQSPMRGVSWRNAESRSAIDGAPGAYAVLSRPASRAATASVVGASTTTHNGRLRILSTYSWRAEPITTSCTTTEKPASKYASAVAAPSE